MKYIKILCVALMLSVTLSAEVRPGLYLNGKKVMEVNPLNLSSRSYDNGGNLEIIDCYKDGVGVFIGTGTTSNGIDNSATNQLVFKYGEGAKRDWNYLSVQVLNDETATKDEKEYASKLFKNIFFEGGGWCDDKNELTLNDSLDEDGYCTGTPDKCQGNGVTFNELKDMIANGEDVTSVCTSNITSMNYLFIGNETFNQDISGWDMSSVLSTSSMFYGATAFNQDISGWDMSSVSSTMTMFKRATSFNQDISGWDMSSVSSLFAMFQEATSFNQDISRWDVGSVINMYQMFKDSTSFNQDLSGWCVENIEEKPGNFDLGATLYEGQSAIQPQWGTCP